MKSKSAVIFSLSCALFAAQASSATIEECSLHAESAHKIMSSRQNGVMLESLLHHPLVKNEPRVYELVIDAYQSPKFRSETMINEVIIEFTNRAMLDCLTSGVK